MTKEKELTSAFDKTDWTTPTMLVAFKEVFGRELNPRSKRDLAIWNAAQNKGD